MRRQQGYVLALNLAVLAIMLMGASFVGQRVVDAVRLAKAEEHSVDVNYELESARARLLMLIATTPRVREGLGSKQASLSLDGAEYRITDKVVVSLQDMRGLVSINGTNLGGFSRERIERLVQTWGVPSAKSVALVDALLDYRDADDLRRLNGAESNEYRVLDAEQDLRNADLLSPNELLRVYGWRDTPELWMADPITDHISTQRGSTFNPNTANWRALVAMTGIEVTTAKNLVETRHQSAVFNDVSRLLFGPGVGDPFGANSFVTPFPSATLVVTLRAAEEPWGYRMVVTHTPGESVSPWRIESVWRLPLPKTVKTLEDTPKAQDAETLRGDMSLSPVKSPF